MKAKGCDALFYGALVLFIACRPGVPAGTIYVLAQHASSAELLPFNIVRMIHTNALRSIADGFMGSTPLSAAGRDRKPSFTAPRLPPSSSSGFSSSPQASLPLSVTCSIFMRAGIFEQPFIIKVGIVVVCLTSCSTSPLTAPEGRKTTVTNILLFGLPCLFPLFRLPTRSISRRQALYWWYVIHLVEGVGTDHGVDPRLPDDQAQRHRPRGRRKWLYVIAGWPCFSGILGTGHHYYWIARARLPAVDRFAVLDARSRPCPSPWSFTS